MRHRDAGCPGSALGCGGAPGLDDMNVQYLNPFIECVVDFFATMLSCEVQRGGVSLSNGNKEPLHLMALIGLSGPVRGMVALSLPRLTVLQITNRLLGEELLDRIASRIVKLAEQHGA